MGSRQKYGQLLDEIACEADAIALRYFRAQEPTTERKRNGTAVTQADLEVETMTRAKVAAHGPSLGVLGEEMSQRGEMERIHGSQTRLIIDPIDGTEEFSKGLLTSAFGGVRSRHDLLSRCVDREELVRRLSGQLVQLGPHIIQSRHNPSPDRTVPWELLEDVVFRLCHLSGPKPYS